MDRMRQCLTDRLVLLEREQEVGEQRLCALAEESVRLQESLLLISGAIQVLREVLGGEPGPEREDGHAEADRG
ncbi:hypothetical protein ACTMTJ_09740 [Phytohabitans sp. LJ34]|uniref:hypothetical protein n=1 Tax=Phytohabitans sp. LJ34 TaxID=3452217 RepID=UPI003F89C673